jgi:hypothetical protein
VLAIAAVLTERRRNGGYLEFRAAQRTGFAIFALALAVQTLFTWLLVNVIDTHFLTRLMPVIAARMTTVYRWFGTNPDQTARAVAGEQGVNLFSFARMLQGLAYNYIFHFLIALLIAAVVKKKAVPVPGS